MRVILASTSPRRRALLALLGIAFDVRDPRCDEHPIPGQTAAELASKFAQAKAHSVAKDYAEALVLGSDTLVELDGSVLGKPADLNEARKMLHLLAGRRHDVQTAVTLVSLSRCIDRTQLSTAHVWMTPYHPETYERYAATGDSLGKAGAYAAQGPGSVLIERLEGDFPTVVGLPLRLVAELLAQAGVQVPVDVEQLYATKPYENWAQLDAQQRIR